MIIRDPDSGQGLRVNEEGQGVVRAITESEIEHASNAGKAFSWDSLDLDIDIGDTLLFVKNTGDTPLILDRLVINGSNILQIYEILIGSLTTTPAGTTVVGINLNRSFSSTLAEATAFSDETAIADGDIVDRVKIAIDGHHIHILTGLILGKNHYVQINQEVEATSGSVILHGHFENPE